MIIIICNFDNKLLFIIKAASLRDQQTGLDPDPIGGDSTHFSGCTPQLEFDAAISITNNARIPISRSTGCLF